MVIPFAKSKLSSYLVYYNTLNISLSFYFSLIRKESGTSYVHSLSNTPHDSLLHTISYPNAKKTHLFVIRLPVHDPVAPVHLLQQDHPHQLMGKGHL